MRTLYDLKVGDRVQVFDRNRWNGKPPGGWDGTVLKVGRVLITVGSSRGKDVYRMDTGHLNGSYPHYSWIKTPEQVVEDNHKADLLRRLREKGIQIQHGFSVTPQQLERLVETMESEEW